MIQRETRHLSQLNVITLSDLEQPVCKVEIRVDVCGRKEIVLELVPIVSVWPEKLGINVLKKERNKQVSKPD